MKLNKLYDLMSITKAAIGLMYINVKGYDDLLNMVGYTEDWDYEDFRKQVHQRTDLKAYARKRLKKEGISFLYCNLAYQVLASEMPEVAFKFGEFIGRPVIQRTRRWVYGNGWKWEHSNYQPLGPHGLHMTKELGYILGSKAVPLLKNVIGIPLKGGWGGCGKNILQRYWHGWFLVDKSAFAIGYVSQIIAVKPGSVSIYFYKEDWDNLNENGEEFLLKII